MRTFKITFITLLAMIMSVVVYAQKPKIRIIATGGTIAGVSASATSSAYGAGQVGIQTLIAAVPQIKDLADVSGEQLVNIGSQDMNDEVWLKLAKRINQLLNNEGYDGVLVTHGTDTMEETAYFLSLTVHSDKPVILVGSMRPSTAISADGPANLYNGVAALVDPSSKGHGVMACMNNELFEAKALIKTHTTDCATFKGGLYGEVGYVYNGKPVYLHKSVSKQGLTSEFNVDNMTSLPKVGIVYGYANCSPLPMQAFVDNHFDGIVLAGVGDGNFYKDVFDVAVKAQNAGIQIVRSSRVPTGPTNLNGEVDDAKYHFVASLNLNPQKARVLLMLALTKTHDWQKIQQYFEEY
ncbi:MAG: type II asparaginase [Prevotella sp.]|jgi:L-asparaginase|nr:type II asparaginase [Prevotella sp.]MDD7336502.1 type II asparaginase [Prevotella sp.]MDY4627236.1 type II asparaginase [Prevotella sp.]MDY5258377.1 type II asparaginase [Prevotella sp.]